MAHKMERKRLNKVFKLNNIENATVKYGTNDKINPQVIFISFKTWIIPTFEDETYVSVFELSKRQIKKIISSFISETNIFSSKYIIDFNLNPNKLTSKGKKFMQIDIFFKQNNKECISINDNIFHSIFTMLINDIMNNLEENDFSLSNRKQTNIYYNNKC